MKTIYVTMDGGLVQNVTNIPAGIEVVVIDYDVEGEEADRLDVSPLDGELCCISRYAAAEEGVHENST